MAWLTATYRVGSAPEDIQARARAIALEQSIECPPEAVTDPRILEEIVGRVAGIEPAGDGAFAVRIELSAQTIGTDPAQLINMIFGNCSLWPNVQLVDIDAPPAVMAGFPGPRHGIAGIRRLLGAPQRAMTCTALKPQGLPVGDLTRIFNAFAEGGVDIVKDDHGIGNQAYSPFEERVGALQQAASAAADRNGRMTFYAPNLTGSPRALRRRAEFARDRGVRVVLAEPMVIGLPAFYDLVDEFPEFIYLAHPAFGGATRIGPSFLYGSLLRMFGADAVIFVNYGGRFSYPPADCAAIAHKLRAPWGAVAPALPVPAGGMLVERVPEMLSFYGNDSMMLIGGNLLIAREHLARRTREYVERVQNAAVPV
jgi:ribulose-bisphosphate carboxylase large chain